MKPGVSDALSVLGTFCPENVGHDCVLRQALNTAIRHCEYFVSTKEHKDIDMMSNVRR